MHEGHKSRVSIGHVFQPHPFMPMAAATAELIVGKDRRVHKHHYPCASSLIYTAAAIALVHARGEYVF